jgi:hypothetical protein
MLASKCFTPAGHKFLRVQRWLAPLYVVDEWPAGVTHVYVFVHSACTNRTASSRCGLRGMEMVGSLWGGGIIRSHQAFC